MKTSEVGKLAELIAVKLGAFAFEELPVEGGIDGIPYVRLWKRKTFNTNRGVALVSMPGDRIRAGEYARSIKMALGKKLRYIPFFYPVGLQIVMHCQGKEACELEKYVDKIDTQTVVLQSIFVVDLMTNSLSEARTWGQIITGKFQDALHEAANLYLEERKGRADGVSG